MKTRIMALIMAISMCFVLVSCGGNSEQKKAEALEAVKAATTFDCGTEAVDLDGVTIDKYLTSIFKLASGAVEDIDITSDWKAEEADGGYKVSLVVSAKDGEEEHTASFDFMYKDGKVSLDSLTEDGEKVDADEAMSSFFMPEMISMLKTMTEL